MTKVSSVKLTPKQEIPISKITPEMPHKHLERQAASSRSGHPSPIEID